MKKVEALEEAKRRQKEAEDYILASGDPHAIKMLMLARANPAHYSQVLAGGVGKGNGTLKMAMGVMAGVAVGNLVANAATAAVLSEALAKFPAGAFTASLDAVGSVADVADAAGAAGDAADAVGWAADVADAVDVDFTDWL
jgi:hypothetical protein